MISVDGHDPAALEKAFMEAKSQQHKPTLICARTVIGFGAPTVEGTAKTHGSALGEAEVARAREQLNWHHVPFDIPKEMYDAWSCVDSGAKAEAAWATMFAAYGDAYPADAQEFRRVISGELPQGFDKTFESFITQCQTEQKAIATRKSSQQCIEFITPKLPECVGGSADLSVSNLTIGPDTRDITPANPGGNYIEYGVREFGMASIANGLALHGGIIPFCATFLVFSDYARNAIRLTALMRQRVIYVFTHDSIGVGEDGPTHQPIEHLASLRLIPQLQLWRPCDSTETAVAWQQGLHYHGTYRACLQPTKCDATIPYSSTSCGYSKGRLCP